MFTNSKLKMVLKFWDELKTQTINDRLEWIVPDGYRLDDEHNMGIRYDVYDLMNQCYIGYLSEDPNDWDFWRTETLLNLRVRCECKDCYIHYNNELFTITEYLTNEVIKEFDNFIDLHEYLKELVK